MRFQPAGREARWRTVYAEFVTTPVGTMITYEQLAHVLGLDGEADRHALQMAARRAGLELERVHSRAVDAVRGQGYRVVEPAEHLTLGRRRNRSARHHLRRGELVTRNVDTTGMDQQTRDALNVLARGFAQQREINRRLEAAQQRQAEVLDMVVTGQEGSREEMERLRARIDRIESRQIEEAGPA